MPPRPAVQAASHLIAAALLYFILYLTLRLHLVPALSAGRLVFVFVDKISPGLSRLTRGRAAHPAASIIAAVITLSLIGLGAVALAGLLKSGGNSGLLPLWEHVAHIIDDADEILPA